MPRKRVNKSPPVERRSDDGDDDDFFFDDTQSSSGRNPQEPVHRNAANARERARMRVLSKAFCRLKTTLPWVPADTKLSKLDTLRLAASYIAHLRALLHDEPRTAAQMFPHPLNLAWPFAFQHGGSLSYSISPRWSANSNPNDAPTDVEHKVQNTRSHQHANSSNDYRQEYSENDYDDRGYQEDPMSSETACGSTMEYCTYGYKDNYYEMRNSYSTDSVMNNV